MASDKVVEAYSRVGGACLVLAAGFDMMAAAFDDITVGDWWWYAEGPSRVGHVVKVAIGPPTTTKGEDDETDNGAGGA